MNLKVIAFAAAVALVLIGQSIDIARVRTALLGPSAPIPEAIEPSFEFSEPDPGMPPSTVVVAPGKVTCGGVVRILPGLRTAPTVDGAYRALPPAPRAGGGNEWCG